MASPREGGRKFLAVHRGQPLVLLLLLRRDRRGRPWHAVQVLVQPVQAEREELLHVLLLVALEEVRGPVRELPVERQRVVHLSLRLPDRFHQLPERLGELAAVAERARDVHVFLKVAIEEVGNEGLDVAEALETGVHEARVPNVLEPDPARARGELHVPRTSWHQGLRTVRPRHFSAPRASRPYHAITVMASSRSPPPARPR
mmetsp:Transcript_14453/g.43261  ORF Transcript_14453/g.43261 Transcript_14453/m.43261 type:complete len:202 (+) Transcript_14453:760-1365(+)